MVRASAQCSSCSSRSCSGAPFTYQQLVFRGRRGSHGEDDQGQLQVLGEPRRIGTRLRSADRRTQHAHVLCMKARLELVGQPVFALHQLCTSPNRAVSPCEYSVGTP